MAEILLLDDPARAAAERLAGAVRAGGQVVLTGGSAPRRAYEQLAGMDLDWSGCVLWFGDDRCVPPDDERSNFGMARSALLDRLSETPDVRRMRGELGPDDGAADYEQQLRATFGGLPEFDLLMLGLGPDGHCASLFPGQEQLSEVRRFAIGVERPGLPPLVPRISLTLPVLNAAGEVLFLVSGAEKALAVKRSFFGEPDSSVPASLVRPTSGRLTVLLDAAAAGETFSA
jgi:6-phosphogluconolactonase